MMADYVLVYVTTPDEESAVHIARTVVDEHLAACVNVLPKIRSFFRWDGRSVEEDECLLLMKTTKAAFEPLRKRIVALHPYKVPCITALPIVDGHAPYLGWVESEVRHNS